MIFKLVKIVVGQIEYAYSWLIDVLIEELIYGEREHDQGVVIQAFLILVILAVFSYYMEFFVDLYVFIGVISLVFCQFSNVKGKKYLSIKDEACNSSPREIMRNYFHEFWMVLFLLVFSNFLPKAGHFIMFWIGPWLGVHVPTLRLDLSLTGIWSIFEFEIEFFDVIDFSLLLLSFIFSIHCWHKAKSILNI